MLLLYMYHHHRTVFANTRQNSISAVQTRHASLVPTYEHDRAPPYDIKPRSLLPHVSRAPLPRANLSAPVDHRISTHLREREREISIANGTWVRSL